MDTHTQPSAFLVVDTNFLVSDLTIVQAIQAWHSKFKHVLVIPWTVIQERASSQLKRLTTVDGLKNSKRTQKGKLIGGLAREAIRWAQDSLHSNNGSVVGQKRHETTDANALDDDAILACCMFLKFKYPAPVTLLTNDNNLSMKAQSNGITALSSTTPNNEPLSSDLLIRQALHGPLPLENTFIRPKEGDDIKMFDLSGTAEDHLKFLPGLKASRYAPKSNRKDYVSQAGISIDPETGAVVLIKNGERIRREASKKERELGELVVETESELDGSSIDGVIGNTYADIMSLESKPRGHKSDDEMDWE